MSPESKPESNTEAKIEHLFEKELSLPSQRASIEEAGIMAEKELEKLGWPDHDVMMFSLCVREAVTNAIVHGNLRIPKKKETATIEDSIAYDKSFDDAANTEKGQKSVTVQFRFSPREAKATITDEGDFEPPKGKDHIPQQAEFSLGGRGMAIIESYIGKEEEYISYAPGSITFIKKRE